MYVNKLFLGNKYFFKVQASNYTNTHPHRFEVHLKLYCTHLKGHSLYCPVQQSQDLRVRYSGYSCPNVPALTVQISVPRRKKNFFRYEIFCRKMKLYTFADGFNVNIYITLYLQTVSMSIFTLLYRAKYDLEVIHKSQRVITTLMFLLFLSLMYLIHSQLGLKPIRVDFHYLDLSIFTHQL